MTTATMPGSLTEHERLKRLLPKRFTTGTASWATESIQMAQAAVGHYDGRTLGDPVTHRLAYHRFFREVVPELYAGCHDIGGASHILGVLIAERRAYNAAAELMNLGAISAAEAWERLVWVPPSTAAEVDDAVRAEGLPPRELRRPLDGRNG